MFAKWFAVGFLVSGAVLIVYIVLKIRQGMASSPEIGAVHFSLEWLLGWTLICGLAVAVIASLVKVFSR